MPGLCRSAGTILALYRAIAAGHKGVWTDIGLHTLADPRLDGSKANEKTVREGKDIVRLVSFDGDDYLYYPTFPIQVCFIRGSLADEDGNISLQREAMIGEQLEVAEATHNSGGIVVVQVEDVVLRGSLDSRLVKIHHFLVDYVVVPRPKYHVQSFSTHGYRPELSGEGRKSIQSLPPHPLDNRKICARRAAMELKKGDVMNLGIGIPEIIGSVAAEEGFGPSLTLAADSGIIGGIPLSGLDMGAAVNAEAELKMADMFDICHGGGLDLCALGLAEIDAMGNVNVSKFHGRVTGPGASSTWPSTRRNSSSWGPLQPAVCENTVKAGGWSSTGKGSTRNSRRISNRSPFPGTTPQPTASTSWSLQNGPSSA